MDEHLPRSETTVETLSKPAVSRIRRRANLAGLGFVGFGVLALVLGIATTYGDPQYTHEQAITCGVAAFAFLGALPGFVVRRMMLADVAQLRGLLALGFAYRGRISAYAKGRDGTTAFTVAWWEADRDARANVEIAGREPMDRTITVVARKGCKDVAVLFGEEVFLGRR